MSEETNSNSDYEPTSAPFGSYQWGQNQREKLQLYEQQSNASYQPPRFHFQSQMMPGFQQTTTTRLVPTNYQERKEHFRMEFLTDSNNSKKASHNAPKLALTTLSTDTQLEEFLTFWAAFEDSVERTNKSWTEKLFLLHQYLDADLRKTFSAFEIAKARNLIGPEKELEFFDIYMSCKAVLFERVQDDTYSTIDRAIANLPKLSRASTTFQLYEYQDVLTKLQRGGLTNLDSDQDPFLKQLKLKLDKTPYFAWYEDFLFPYDRPYNPDNLNSMARFFQVCVDRSQHRTKHNHFVSGFGSHQQPKSSGGKVSTHAVGIARSPSPPAYTPESQHEYEEHLQHEEHFEHEEDFQQEEHLQQEEHFEHEEHFQQENNFEKDDDSQHEVNFQEDDAFELGSLADALTSNQ